MNYIKKNIESFYENDLWPDLDGKDVLITGGTGLIGVHLDWFFHLLRANITMVYKSPIPNYFLQYLPESVVKDDYPYFTLIQMDWTNYHGAPIHKAMLGQFDYIIHCAGYAQPSKFIANPFETININTVITHKLFNLLKKNGTFLYVSSDAIYTGCEDNVFNEDSLGKEISINDPRYPYIASKRLGEYITKHNGGISARLSYVYGPGCKLDDTRVINELIIRALKKNKDIVRGGLGNLRSWLYVSDAIKMLLNILFFAYKGDIYNIANKPENAITINEVNNIIKTIINYKELNCPEILPGISTKADITAPINPLLSINKYENHFGKMKFTPLINGLTETINWHRQNLKG